MTIIIVLMPPTTPDTVPTVCMSATGSFDLGAIVIMKKKKTTPSIARAPPTITSRQFLRRTNEFLSHVIQRGKLL